MVCNECSKKLEKLITPEFTKNANSNYSASNSILSSASSERMLNQNMMLNRKRYAYDPSSEKCISCRGRVENKNKYCLTCAYTRGLCELCGRKMVDTKMYKFTDVDPKDVKRRNKMSAKTKLISDKVHNKRKEKEKVDNKKIIKANKLAHHQLDEKINFGKEGKNQNESIQEINIHKVIEDSNLEECGDENEYDEIIKV